MDENLGGKGINLARYKLNSIYTHISICVLIEKKPRISIIIIYHVYMTQVFPFEYQILAIVRVEDRR